MKIGIIVARHASHQVETAKALQVGMQASGDSAEIVDSDAALMARTDLDAVCVWGWRRGSAFRERGFNVLVMERGYVADRFVWTSLGWNGLNGRATWPDNSNPSRWERYFSHLLEPWCDLVSPQRYALLLGQVPSDAACRGVAMESWLATTAEKLKMQGRRVLFRPHPKAPFMRIPGVAASTCASLIEDFSISGLAVTWNSNSGVDAVLAGVPTVACDPGSMAWDVAAHSIDEKLPMPDRRPWAHRLAWRQWLREEIAAGLAWPHVKGALLGQQ